MKQGATLLRTSLPMAVRPGVATVQAIHPKQRAPMKDVLPHPGVANAPARPPDFEASAPGKRSQARGVPPDCHGRLTTLMYPCRAGAQGCGPRILAVRDFRPRRPRVSVL